MSAPDPFTDRPTHRAPGRPRLVTVKGVITGLLLTGSLIGVTIAQLVHR